MQGFVLCNADYTYTGIGFGGSTGSYYSNQIIDDFQIWVAELTASRPLTRIE